MTITISIAPRRLRALAGVLGVAAMLSAGATSAQADSISFLRGGDIWAAATDGSGQVQLTSGGGYSYHSRADDGSMIALKGRQLHRLTADGKLLAAFDTPASDPSTVAPYLRGPFKPEISPDGSKVAYEYLAQAAPTPGCTGVLCAPISQGIGYTWSDRQTGWDEPGLGRQSGWLDPSWIDNASVLLSNKYVRPNVDTIIDHPGDGNDTILRWFEFERPWYLKDAELSRRGDAVVAVTTLPRSQGDPRLYQQDDMISVFRTNGPAPAEPDGCFYWIQEDRRLASPSIAPDGRAVAFESVQRSASSPNDAGPPRIEVGPIPDQSSGCADPESGTNDLIMDATNPDWSPAGVPVIGQPGGGGSGGGGGTGPGGGTGGGGGAGGGATPNGNGTVVEQSGGKTTVSKGGVTLQLGKGKLAASLKRGLKPKATLPSAGKLEATLRYKGKTVAKGSTKAKRAGTRTLTLKFTAAGKRALKSVKKPKLTLRFTWRPTTGPRVKSEATLKLG